MRIFYDYKRAICGESKIMYRGKWYLLLDATEEYVIIRCRNKYVKIDKYDVEDCTYHNVIYEKNGMPRLANARELAEIRRSAEFNITTNYDVDEILACKQDMELHKSKNFKLFFLSGMLTRFTFNSNNTELYNMFDKFMKRVSALPLGDNRHGINMAMVDIIPPVYYSTMNALFNKFNIFTDSDAIRCLSYNFVINLLYIIEGE